MTKTNETELGITTTTGYTIAYQEVRKAMNGERYTMKLAASDAAHVIRAVNQGIDSHLEACFVPARGDMYFYEKGKLYCAVSEESFPVLLRRLYELDASDSSDEYDDDSAGCLADTMLAVLGFDEYGKYVGREALGMD